jgi:hypothetical protein
MTDPHFTVHYPIFGHVVKCTTHLVGLEGIPVPTNIREESRSLTVRSHSERHFSSVIGPLLRLALSVFYSSAAFVPDWFATLSGI